MHEILCWFTVLRRVRQLHYSHFYLSQINLVIWDWVIWFAALVQSLSGHTSPIESVAFDSPEVLVLAGASSGVIKLWDLEETKSKSLYLFSSIFYKIYTAFTLEELQWMCSQWILKENLKKRKKCSQFLFNDVDVSSS